MFNAGNDYLDFGLGLLNEPELSDGKQFIEA